MNEAILFVAFIAQWFLYVSENTIFFKRQEHQLIRPLDNTYIVFKKKENKFSIIRDLPYFCQ